MVPALASKLDAWVAAERATIGETVGVLTVYGLTARDAADLVADLAVLAWPTAIEDPEGNPFVVADLEAEFEPFRVSADKPPSPPGVRQLVTCSGFADWLDAPTDETQIQVAGAGHSWATWGARFGPWGHGVDWAPRAEPVRVRRVVRETSNAALLPEDLRPWILATDEGLDLASPACRLWAWTSARHLVRAVANEVETPAQLLFRGPPALRLELDDDLLTDLGQVGFMALQAAADWIFSSSREMDTRHDFFAAEVPRGAPPRAVAGKVLERVAESALEGAKIAYQLYLSQVGRDSLKAMADLRKAVADETGKLADSTRGVVGAVAAAALGGVGLIAARLTLKAPQWPAVLLALALSLHVAAVIWSGFQFLGVQRKLRASWRSRLYAFLTDQDFRALVVEPVGEAEDAFRWTAALGGVAAFAVLAASVLLPD